MPGHHIIVGGGLAGLTAAMKLAEQGEEVDLFSIVPVKRSHSVCAQGGINGAVNTKGEGDSPMIHFDDTIYGGDFLAHQPPVKAMCEAAPSIIYLFDRMGVMFNRTPEGLLDFRRFGGTKHHRTAFAGATTGQQLLYALDEQVRRYEATGLVRKFEGWEMLSLVQDESGDCRGIVAIDTRSLEMRAFPGRHDDDRDRRPGPGLRPLDAVAGEHRIGGQRVLPGGRDLRQRRVHPGASDRDAGRGQVSAHLGVDSRRGRARVDLSRRQAVVLPRRDVSGVRQPGAARYRDPRDSQGRVRDEARHRRPTAGLPRREPSRSRGAESQGRGRARNLREVCRPGSAQSSDEDFPGDALLDGRAVGRLPSADQHAGAVRGGRVRVSVSRREPARARTRCCRACTAEISRSRR